MSASELARLLHLLTEGSCRLLSSAGSREERGMRPTLESALPTAPLAAMGVRGAQPTLPEEGDTPP